MDAMTQMAQALGSIPTTPEEKRRAKNRRYYERNQFIWEMNGQIKKLRRLLKRLEN